MTIYSTRVLGLAVLPLALALAACGGDSSPTPPAIDRIEPYDPGVAKAAAAASGPLVVAPPARVVALGPLEPSLKSKSGPTKGLGTALQIGQARTVTDTVTTAATTALLQWHDTARGTLAAALRFTAEGARGIRLGLLIDALPSGSVLRFYGATTGDAVEVTARQLQDAARRNAEAGMQDTEARTYWSPDFGGPETTLEIEISAASNPRDVLIAVPRLSHFTLSPAEAENLAVPATRAAINESIVDAIAQGNVKQPPGMGQDPMIGGGGWANIYVRSGRKAGESASCTINAICSPEYADQSRAVARMVYVRNGDSYLCTGTLLNDAKSSGTPYFLSANHCISDQAAASSLNTDWFYRTVACDSAEVNPGTRRLTGGATLLYAAEATDVALLRLNEAPPQGIVYAGSYFGGAPSVGTVLAGLHHPGGDLQKFSLGSVLGNASCTNDSKCDASPDGNFIGMSWQQGITETGSSGSAVFIPLDGKRYVVGQLLGGGSSCEDPKAADYYGRFDLAYRSALHKWLSP